MGSGPFTHTVALTFSHSTLSLGVCAVGLSCFSRKRNEGTKELNTCLFQAHRAWWLGFLAGSLGESRVS